MAEPKEDKKEKNEGPKTLKQVYAGYAEKATSKVPHEVDIIENLKVEFTADYGKHIKKGHKQSVSRVAYDLYNGLGVIKLQKGQAEPIDMADRAPEAE